MILAKCTIYIPYHTHPKTIDFLRRQISYYHHYKMPQMRILVAVSGDDTLIDEIKNYIKNLSNSSIDIFVFEEKNIKNVSAFIQKIADGLAQIQTPYVCINGADDVVIPGVLEGCVSKLECDPKIAGVKGKTIYYNQESGIISIGLDDQYAILDDSPLARIQKTMKDLDSLFYITRRTDELKKECNAIASLAKTSVPTGSSLYHIEHLKALLLGASGKVVVLDSPWRLQTSQPFNHTSHTPASFLRLKFGPIEKNSYELLQSMFQNLNSVSYIYYRFLWILMQIKGFHVTMRQIVYFFTKRKLSFIGLCRLSLYYLSHEIYVLRKKTNSFSSPDLFFLSDEYRMLKKNYFTTAEIVNIESFQNQ